MHVLMYMYVFSPDDINSCSVREKIVEDFNICLYNPIIIPIQMIQNEDTEKC